MSAVASPSAPAFVDPLSVPLELPARRHGRRLRLKSLSPASLRAFEKCPEAFRRTYLLEEKVPPNLSMTLGSVVGDTLARYFAGRIVGRAPGAAELDDLVLELFAAKIGDTVLGLEDDPDLGKAQCRAAVADYLTEIAPSVEPVSVERRASFRFDAEQEWRFVCYFDVECERLLADLKFGRSTVKEDRAYRDLQATAQTFMRWAERNPAEFVFHAATLERPEDGPRWQVVRAPRSIRQLLGFQRRVARVARMIAHLDATEPAEWPLAADFGWWCAPRVGGEGCPHWDRCPVGGGPIPA
ncbi:MAG: PD-(D/E)XK nuclease family protein [Actinobacteria bacterium]|nr:PD-(D/E)XK nuclease family protein [Actinomycetota bacterium]MBS1882935.1 PD-(D/E)XK nuclease family protein [Actinomycetota bacterium]